MRRAIEIGGIRKEQHKSGWTRLVADIAFEGFNAPFEERVMWFAVEETNAEMLCDDSYDAFFLVPLYLAMQYGAELVIHGEVSKKLYRNMMDYGQQIFCNFSPSLAKVPVSVEGFTTTRKKGNLIGTGISCGVDSLSTINDRFAHEDDPDYKINALFIFNCGTHGDYEDGRGSKVFEARSRLNQEAADELGLPVYQVDTNLHAFTHKIGEQKMGFLALYSCSMSVQSAVRKYYTSSALRYDELLQYYAHYRDVDMAGYSESYLVPLIQTDWLELVLDGAQYTRVEKTERIANWGIAQRHLNVCVNTDETGSNCSQCQKCIRTIVPLEAMEKLDDFSGVFDIHSYRTVEKKRKLALVSARGKDPFSTEIVDYARQKGLAMPAIGVALLSSAARLVVRAVRKYKA